MNDRGLTRLVVGKSVRRRQSLQALGHVDTMPCENWERVADILDCSLREELGGNRHACHTAKLKVSEEPHLFAEHILPGIARPL